MDTIFHHLDSCVVFRLQENYNPRGVHVEYKDKEGKILARMAKVFKQGAFLGLFVVFQTNPDLYAELKDAEGNVLLTSNACWGEEMLERKVEISAPDGTLLGILYDSEHGVDFARPDGAIIGRARRSEAEESAQGGRVYTYTDAAGQPVGTCVTHVPGRDMSTSGQVSELVGFLSSGTSGGGGDTPYQIASVTAPVDPDLHLFLMLFPALQHLRYTKSY